MGAKRLRIIAGPNGSGKTTLYFFLKGKISTGIWLNADEILEHFSKKGFIEYMLLGFTPTKKSFTSFCNLASSQKFIKQFYLQTLINKLGFADFSITYADKLLTNELVAFLTDFFRYHLLKDGFSFTTETVLSHPSKLALVKTAVKNNYKTYLYFIGTKSPEINVRRITPNCFKCS